MVVGCAPRRHGPKAPLGLGLLLAAGCGGQAFVCEDDEGCDGQAGGQCEAIGYCSFADEACPSGRRYGGHSGDFSGRCVTDDDGSGTTAPDSTGPSPSTTTGGSVETTVALEDGSGSSGPPLTASGSDGGSSQGDPTSTGAVDSSTTENGTIGTTDDPGVQLCMGPASLEEPFDAWPLDPATWGWWASGGAEGTVVDGAVRISVDVAAAGESAYGDAYAAVPLPAAGSAGLEVLTIPPASAPAELFFGLSDQEVLYGIDLYDGNVVTFERINPDMFAARVSVPFDAVDHRWLRMSFTEAGTLAWERSSDGEQWIEIDSESDLLPIFDLPDAQLVISCGAWSGPTVESPLCAYDNAFICGE